MFLPAVAAAGWTPARTVSGDDPALRQFGQAVAPDGTGTVVWARPSDPGSGYLISSRTVALDGALGPVVDLSLADPAAALTTASAPAIAYSGAAATVVWLESSYDGDVCLNDPEAEPPEPGEECVVTQSVRSRRIASDGSLGSIEVLDQRETAYPAEGPFGGMGGAFVAYGQPALAPGPDGGMTVVWSESEFAEGCSAYGYAYEYGGEGCAADHAARWIRVSAAGSPIGSPQALYGGHTDAGGSANSQVRVQLAAAADGTATVVLTARTGGEPECWGGEREIQTRRIESDGSLSSPATVDSGCGGVEPRLAIGPGGVAFLVWSWAEPYVAAEIRYSRIPAGGLPDDPGVLLAADGETAVAAPTVAAHEGEAIALWGAEGDLQARSIPATGELGPVRTLAAAPSSGRSLDHLELALAADGSGLAAWETGRTSGPGFEAGVEAVEIAPDGTPGPVRTLMSPNRWDHGPRLAVGADGDFLAAWRLSTRPAERIQTARPGAGTPMANDAFAEAEEIAGPVPLFAAGSNEDAGKEPGEPPHAGDPGGSSLWYSWTPEDDGSVVLSTCSSGEVDTLLAVYTGSVVGGLSEVRGNDDSPLSECAATDSVVRFEAAAGTTYRIAVDGKGGEQGSFALEIDERPGSLANDDFDHPRAIGGSLPWTTNGSTYGATREDGEPEHAGQPGGASLWFSWTPDEDGLVSISTCASGSFDPVLAVYEGSSLEDLEEVASGDDDSTHPTCGADDGEVRFEAEAGTTYRIAVDGKDGGEGFFTLELLAVPTNDDFVDAEVLDGFFSASASADNRLATKEPGEPPHAGDPGGASLWYSWTPSSSGEVVIATCSFGDIDPVLAVYTGAALGSLSPVASDDDGHSGCAGKDAELELDAVAGTTYRIVVDSKGGIRGPVSLSINSRPSNDDFSGATPIVGPFPQERFDSNSFATKEPGEPPHAGDPGGASLWYSWTAPSSSTVSVAACSFFVRPVLGVYTGASVDQLTEVAGSAQVSDPSCSTNRSEVVFEAIAGTTYRIAVDGELGGRGFFSLYFSASPANDAFDTAEALESELPAYASGNSGLATKEPGEPPHAGDPGGASLWYSWTPEVSGTVATYTCTFGAFDTVLGVYTGAALADLEPVASNDDGPSDFCEDTDSEVRFEAEAGTTYRIAVDGKGGGSGPFELVLEGAPGNDDLENAFEINADPPVFRWGSNRVASRQPEEPEHDGNGGGASVWYSWTPSVSRPVEVALCGEGGLDPLLGVYTGESPGDLSQVAAAQPGADPGCVDGGRVVGFTATADTTYLIAVDGRDGDQGFFGLSIYGRAANDDFVNAQALPDSPPVWRYGDNRLAGKEPLEPDHAGDPGGASLWYSWTSTEARSVAIAVCGFSGLDPLLGVYTGSGLGDLTEVAAGTAGSDEWCASSEVRFEAEAGTTYWIAVDGKDGSEGSFELSLVGSPSNDDFAAASELNGSLPRFTWGDNALASKQEGEPDHTGNSGGASVWYSWEAPEDGLLTASVCGFGQLDPLLGIYTGESLGELTELASAIGVDHGECFGGEAEATFEVVAGTVYRVAVDGADGSEGEFELTLRAAGPPNDDFADAIEIDQQHALVAGTTLGATVEFGENSSGWPPAENTVWYSWTAPNDETVHLHTCADSGAPMDIDVFTGSSVGSLDGVDELPAATGGSCLLNPAAESDSAASTPIYAFEADAGTTYQIAIDSHFQVEPTYERLPPGPFLLALNAPANDLLGAAQRIPAAGAGLERSNVGATREAGEDEYNPSGGASIWFRWFASADGPVRIDTCGSEIDTLLGTLAPDNGDEDSSEEEYSGDLPSPGGGSVIVSSDDSDACAPGSLQSSIEFEASEDFDYLIAVDGKGGETGAIHLNVEFASADTTPPDTNGDIPAAINSSELHFSVQRDEPESSFECALDDAPFSACQIVSDHLGVVRLRVGGLAEGEHVLEVREVDPTGNADPTPLRGEFTVDTIPPETTIVNGPAGLTRTIDPFVFVANEPGADFECAFDGGSFSFCVSPFSSYGGLPDGEHTFQVRAMDPAGNVDPSPDARSFTLDRTPPAVVIDQGPAGTVETAEVAFVFSADEAATFRCRLDSQAEADCTSPWQLSGLADEDHAFTVRATDAAGNVGDPLTREFRVEARPPETTLQSGPPAHTTTTSASFAFSADEQISAFQCSLDESDFESCTAPHDLSGLADGEHTFRVRAVDLAGKVDPSPASHVWRVDTTPPDTEISDGPEGTVASPSPHFQFAGDPAEDTDRFECELDGSGFAPCPATGKQYSGLADGEHTFQVRAVDAVGNADPSPASRTWTVDTTPPDTAITDGPEATVASAAAQLGFEGVPASDTDRFECRLDSEPFAPCPATGKQYSGLADGEHTFRVRAVDAVGNADPSPASRTWTVDTTPPQTTIIEAPAEFSPDTEPSISFESSETDSSFACKLDAAEFVACEAPFQLVNLPEGEHTFQVQATDPVGNTDESPAELIWTVDVTPPETSLDEGPNGVTSSESPSFSFSSSEAGGGFECRLDDGEFASCTSPRFYLSLEDGEHSFAVRALDAAGNLDETPVERTWAIDTTPPDTSIDSGPSGTVPTASVEFAYSGDPAEDTDRFECELDGSGFAPCPATGKQYSGLADGEHTFRVRAVDAVGNADTTPAARTFGVEDAPPETSIDSGPSGPTSDADVSFAFSSNEPASTFECKLDAEEFAACESPRSYLGLADGEHEFAVRTTDPSGMVDSTPAIRSFAVDTVAPDTALVFSPPEGTAVTAARFEYAGLPGGDTDRFECRLDEAEFESCPNGGRTYRGLAEGQHSFEVRAVDAAGNTDPTPATATFLAAVNLAPEATLSLSSLAGVAPLDLEATPGGGDPNGDPLEYSLSFGDGSSPASGSLPHGSVSHTYGRPGAYQVRLTVSDGELTSVETATVVVDLPQPLQADAGDDLHGVAGQPVQLNAGASQPGGLISAYEWDFGDGSTGSGVAPTHTYSESGTYTATVTVSSGSETDTDSAEVIVTEPAAPGGGLTVEVRGGGVPLPGATVGVTLPDGSRNSAKTDGSGKTTLTGLSEGAVTVYAWASGFQPSLATVTVEEGGAELTLNLEPGELGAATLESDRLTYDEIIERGIDVADPENSHVYEAKIHLYFAPDEPTTNEHVIRVYVAPEGVHCVSDCSGHGGGGGGGGGFGTPWFGVGGYRFTPSVSYVEGEPIIQWLVLPIRASFLKEFFDVRMVVQNLTEGFSFEPGAAGLQLPAGLSLAPTATPQATVQQVGAIPGGESRTIEWVVRGDVEGEYDLTADYSASLQPSGLPVYLRAQTRTPLKVWGASALKMRILVDERATRWGPYGLDVEVRNVSDVPVYNMQVEMLDREADAPENEALFFYAPAPPQVQGTARIEPGETWTASYVLFAGLGNEEVTRLRLLLEKSFVERTGGDVDLEPELALRDGESLGPAAGPVNVKVEAGTGGEDEAILSWLRPAAPDGLAVTGYELWTRQALDRGTWSYYDQVATTESGGESMRIPARDRAAGRYYAIGTKYSNGRVHFQHRLGVGPARYVALGDSYSAGEGVPEFQLGTAADISPVPAHLKEQFPFDNKCHRSELGSYGQRLIADESLAANLRPAKFFACSGAVTRDLETANPRNEGEPRQLDHLSQFTNLVTLTMGGNDVGFADIAALCLALDCGAALEGLDAIGTSSWFDVLGTLWSEDTFFSKKVKQVMDAANACANPADLRGKFMCAYKAYKVIADNEDPKRAATPPYIYNGVLQARLERVYLEIAQRAPNARVLVQLYPQIVAPPEPGSTCWLYPGTPFSLSHRERTALRTVAMRINAVIQDAVNSVNSTLGASGPRQLEVVPANHFGGHELCGNAGLNEASYFNSVVFPGVTAGANTAISYSFHPNAGGQEAFAKSLAEALEDDIESNVFEITPNESKNAGTVFVPFGGRTLHARSAWFGSTVTMSLVSPGGEVHDADTPGVRSGGTETSQWLEVPDPEPGTWQVRLFGDDVPVGGEPTQVTAYAETPPPDALEVEVAATPVAGEVDSFDLSATGPAGSSYVWAFSDGTGATGPEVRHAFSGGGRMWATVQVTAPSGGAGWSSVDLGAPAVDEVAPWVADVPKDQTVEATGSGGAVVDYTLPAALDDVDGEVSVSCSPPPGSTFPPGVTTVTCDAEDAAGNVTSVSFEVTVEGGDLPDDDPGDSGDRSSRGSGGSSSVPTVNAPSAGSPQPVPAARGVALFAGVGLVKARDALIRARCVGGPSCRGVVRLTAKTPTARKRRARSSRQRRGRRAKQALIGRGRFDIDPGAPKTVRIRLTGTGRRLLRQSGRRGTRAKLVGTGLRSRAVVLKVQGKKQRKRVRR